MIPPREPEILCAVCQREPANSEDGEMCAECELDAQQSEDDDIYERGLELGWEDES